MGIILDGLGLEGSVLDGLADWPALTTRKEWFAITCQLIKQTIADLDLDPAALTEVEEAFIGAGLLWPQSRLLFMRDSTISPSIPPFPEYSGVGASKALSLSPTPL